MRTPSMLRTRWAAAGAALAVSLGAGGVGLLHATSPDGAAAFVPITACRLFDTRPDSQVGPRNAPLGPNDAFDVTATGAQGNCNLPAEATGVVLNVTAVGADQPTFLTLWPTGTERPTASALNPVPDAPPTPNAVTTDLNDAGQFTIYNFQGSVHVLADAVGYYVDHHHDERYYTKADVDAAIDAAVAEAAGQADAAIAAAAAAALAAGDARYAPRVPAGPLVLSFGDFTTTGSGWELQVFPTHTAPDNGCIVAPAAVPAGAAIKTVELSYGATASTTATVSMLGLRTTPGPIQAGTLYLTYLANADFPLSATPSQTVLGAIVPHDPADVSSPIATAETVNPDYITLLAICTTGALTLTGIRVNYDV